MEPILGGAASSADGGADLIKNGSTATFMTDVIDASHEAAVIVDFWAPWCGPCKTLGPMIEKAVKDAKGAVRLVKIDIDKNQQLAQQMRIQSIPAVYAFKDGRPVDAFVGAVPESEIKQFVARLGGAKGPSPIEEALILAKEAMTEGDLGRAQTIFSQVLQHEPDNVDALAGVARTWLAKKEFTRARQFLSRIPPEAQNHPDVVAARTGLDLAEAGAKAQGALGELRARLERDANDHQARFDLAGALFASGERENAVDELLDLVRRDRKWNDEGARKQLVKFFEAMGGTDPLTQSARRRLSSILFS
jgi:putative thioredoxin